MDSITKVSAMDVIAKLHAKEKRSLGTFLLNNISTAINEDIVISSVNAMFLESLFHDAMNRFDKSWKSRIFSMTRSSDFSFWTEARDIATWINSLS